MAECLLWRDSAQLWRVCTVFFLGAACLWTITGREFPRRAFIDSFVFVHATTIAGYPTLSSLQHALFHPVLKVSMWSRGPFALVTMRVLPGWARLIFVPPTAT